MPGGEDAPGTLEKGTGNRCSAGWERGAEKGGSGTGALPPRAMERWGRQPSATANAILRWIRRLAKVSLREYRRALCLWCPCDSLSSLQRRSCAAEANAVDFTLRRVRAKASDALSAADPESMTDCAAQRRQRRVRA